MHADAVEVVHHVHVFWPAFWAFLLAWFVAKVLEAFFFGRLLGLFSRKARAALEDKGRRAMAAAMVDELEARGVVAKQRTQTPDG